MLGSMDLWSLLQIRELWVAALAVAAIMVTLKRFTRALAPNAMSNRWFKAFVSLQNVTWGLVIAVPRFLPGERYGQRAIYGLVAGLFSLLAYHTVLKRMGEAKAKTPTQGEA